MYRALVFVLLASAALAATPQEWADAYRAERAKAADGERLMPGFPVAKADDAFRRGEQALTAGRANEAVRYFREARWLLPPVPPEVPAHTTQILGNARFRHSDPIVAVAYSADGKYLATGGRDHSVRVWDLGNGRLVRTYLGHKDHVYALAFLPGNRVISGAGKELHIWDVTTGKLAKKLGGTLGNFRSLAVHPNHKLVLTGSGDNERIVRLWDLDSNAEPINLGVFSSSVHCVAWSADGHFAGASMGDGTFAVWDCRTNDRKKILDQRAANTASQGIAFARDAKTVAVCGEKVARQFTMPNPADPTDTPGALRKSFEGPGGHGDMVTCLAFSPDGTVLATGSKDNSVRLWDVASGQLRRTLLGHTEEVTALAFAPDGKQLASVSYDFNVRLWDLEPVLPTTSLPAHTAPIWTVAASPDGSTVATAGADRIIRIADVSTGREIKTLTGSTDAVTALAWSADGQSLFSVGGDKLIRMWDPATGAQTKSINASTAALLAIALAPDGRRIAVAGGDRKVSIFDRETGKLATTGALHGGPVTALVWINDTVLASGSADGMVKYWDFSANKETGSFRAHDTGGTAALVFEPTGPWLISAGGDKLVKIWKYPTLRGSDPIYKLAGHAGPLSALALSADGRRLASAGADHVVKVWDLTNRTELFAFRGHADWVTALALAGPRALVAGDVTGKALIWPTDRGTGDASPLGHLRGITVLAAAANTLLSGSLDRTAIAWDTTTGHPRRVYTGHLAKIEAVALAADGSKLATLDANRRVRFLQTADGKELFNAHVPDPGYAMIVTRDGGHVLVTQIRQGAGEDDVNPIIVALDANGKSEDVITDKTSVIACVSFSPDASLAAAGSPDGKLRVWRLADKKKVGPERPAHASKVNDVAIAPDNKTVLTSDDSGEVRIWPVEGGEQLASIKTDVAGLMGLSIAPNGQRFLSFNGDTVAVFDMTTRQVLRRWSLPQRLAACVFTADSRRLAVGFGDGTVYLLELP